MDRVEGSMQRARCARAVRTLTLAAVLLAGTALVRPAAADVLPPPASVCADQPTPDLPGSTPTQPGTWWNPQRYGTSWALMYQDNDTELTVVWYTYDAAGRPVWLLAGPAPVISGVKWSAPLRRQSWNWESNTHGGETKVGSVAISFIDGEPMRAALRWQWSGVDGLARDECIHDFARPGPLNAVNTAFNGFWFEPALPGYGLSLQMQVNTDVDPTTYSEVFGLTLYDDGGSPVWLMGTAPTLPNAPPLNQARALTLDYIRAGAGYPNKVPTTDCTADAGNCFVVHPAVGNLTRTITSAIAGTATLAVSADAVGTNALPGGFPLVTKFDRPPGGVGTVPIAKATAATQVLVDRTVCEVPLGETTCNVTVNWAVHPNLASVSLYRVNLLTQAATLLSTAKSGELVQALAAGTRVQYELRQNGVPAPLHKTPEVKAIAPVDPLADVPDAALTPQATLDARLGTHDPGIGTLAGSASTDGGAAGYRVPIVLPPGRRGMAPDLALSYDSRAGNGAAGMGWSLDGTSSIARCPQTVAQDGRARAVTFAWNEDRLCLDGQRLIAISGAYGARNTVYATEIDSFVRILQRGGSLDEPGVFFEARQKDGEVWWYGGVDLDGHCATVNCTADTGTGTSQPRQLPTLPNGGAQPLALAWPIERRVDTRGNVVRYVYATFGAGELLLTDVFYTGRQTTAPKASTDGDRRVRIAWQPRPVGAGRNDVATTYLAGLMLRQTQRLASITTYVGSQPVRDYTASYQTSTGSGRSLLLQLRECAYRSANAKDCKPGTQFAWDAGAASYQLRADARVNAIADEPFSDMDADFSTSVRFQAVGDFNGDGSRELLWKGPSGGQTPVPEQRLVSLRPDRSVAWSLTIPVEQVGTYGGQHTDFTGRADFDLDGRADLITLPKPAPDSSTRKIVLQHWHGAQAAASFASAFTVARDTGIVVDDLRSIVFTGDMNGDGRPDIVTERYTPDGGATCAARVVVYLNLPGATPSTPPTFAAQPHLCLAGVWNQNNGYFTESVAKVADISGDGLPDLWLNDTVTANGFARALVPAWTRSNDTVWSSLWSSQAANGYFAGGRITQETKRDLFALWMDANGDGLEDWVYARATGNGGEWTLRLNVGRGFGERVALGAVTSLHRLGIEDCGTIFGNQGCSQVWQPWRAGLIRVMDTDGDGRDELLVPRAFAARVCTLHQPEQNEEECPNAVPPPDDGASLLAPQPGVGPDDTCDLFYYCPEDPSGATVTPTQLTLKFDGNSDGVPESATALSESRPIYGRAADAWDRSSYLTAAIAFVDAGPNAMTLRRTDLPIVVNGNSGWSADDIYGDGLVDAPLKVACFDDIARRCAVPWKDANNITLPSAHYPLSLPNGLPLFTRKALLNENTGPGGQLASDGKTPTTPDMLVGVVDGLGVATTWEYYPLASRAGRSTSQTPLYKPASSDGPAYVDRAHINFTSTMPVVSTMTSSNGVGGTRVWRYGYEAAVYHQQGRGFQGFRTVIEEDVTAKVRVRTSFEQRFPLAGRPTRRRTEFILPSNADAPIEQVDYTWRCNRANRSDTAACSAFVPGAGAYPYLDRSVTHTYDPTVAQTGAVPVGTSVRVETNASGTVGSSCTVAWNNAAASGFDAYGNLLGSVLEVWDKGPADQLLLSKHCRTTNTSFIVNASPNVWWVDQQDRSHTRSHSVHDAAHALPTGAINTVRNVYTDHSWNPDRTVQSLRVSEEEAPTYTSAAPVTLTTYGYNGDGMPTSEMVHANNRTANGTFEQQLLRRTYTTYSADGYFPATVSRYVTGNTLHTTTTVTRSRDGQPELVIDPNGLRTKMQYDAFGTPVSTQYRNAADTANRMPERRSAVAACGSCAPFGTYKVTTVQDGAPKTVSTFDLLGRVVREESQLLDGTMARTDTEYDELGRTIATTAPYRGGETPQTTYITDFDLAGRPGTVLQPRNLVDKDGRNFGDLRTIFAYSGRRVTRTACGTQPSGNVPAPCRTTSQTSDALGRVLQATDAAGQTTRTWYDGAGNTIALQGVDGVVTTARYDGFGHRIRVDDPDQGTWTFAYNGVGDLRYQRDARGIATTFDVDWLGRTTARKTQSHAAPTGLADASLDTVVDTYYWDPANARGQPGGHLRTVNGVTERQQLVTYDVYSRPTEQATAQFTGPGSYRDYRHRSLYDGNYGRLKAEAWPNNAARRLLYAASGHLLEERNPLTQATYRKVTAVDARGQTLSETLGALTATRTYAASTGQMLSFAYTAGNTLRRTQSYRYDLFANLSRRVLDSGVNGITATTETFGNDVLDRLTQSQRSGGATGTVTYAYATNGNLRTKSDYSLGNGYAYGAVGKNLGGNAGPHAVRQVQRSAEGGNGTVNFSYDNNGNLTAVTDPTLPFGALYDHRNLPTYLQRGAATSRLFYGADDQRARQTGSDGTHIYLPGFEDVIAAGGTAPVESRAYLGDYAVLARSANGDTFEYLLTDRLGSVDAVASTAGALTEKRAYDAFGAPRNGTTWANLAPKRLPSLAVTQKGYTAHEHLDSVDLIHMNGRAYDYKVGRFLSVDPLITFPLNSQSLNPYSYVMNNPLSWTDPSGFSPCGIMVCPILPKRRFWMDEIREKYAFSIRPNGGGGGRIGVGSSRGRKTVATVEVLALSNGEERQSTLGADRADDEMDGASDLGAQDSRKIQTETGFAQHPIREFSPSEIETYGDSIFAPGTDVGSLKGVMTRDLKIVGQMVLRSFNQELLEIFNEMNVEIDHSDWSKKYSSESMQSIAYAQANFQEKRITFNARRLGLASMSFYRIEQIFHEMRHLMRANESFKIESRGKLGDKIENDARDFARDFMIKYWRAPIENGE